MNLYTQRASLFGATGATVSERKAGKKNRGPVAVPAHAFVEERAIALAPDVATRVINLDLSKVLELPYPATSPSILASYVCIAKHEEIAPKFNASIEFYFVIRGSGRSAWGDEGFDWKAGDLFFLPGGTQASHRAGQEGAVLYSISDEPLLQFLRLRGPAIGGARFSPVHFEGERIAQQQSEMLAQSQDSGAINFGVDGKLAFSSIVPTWKWLTPGREQQPHRHSTIAVQIFTQGENCFSMVGDKRFDWQDYLVTVTPAGNMHSHHNKSDGLGVYLVTQDYPLHRYLRTYWYEYPGAGVREVDWPEADD